MTEHTPPPATNGHVGAVLESFNAAAEHRRKLAAEAQQTAEQLRARITALSGEDTRDADRLAALERETAELRRVIGDRRELLAAASADEIAATSTAARLQAEAEYMDGVVERERALALDPAATRTDMPEVTA